MPSSETTSVEDFYPRPPRGGRHEGENGTHAEFIISIHALREEGDEVCGADRRICEISIHALREEGDPCVTPALSVLHISIHALREEGDFSLSGVTFVHFDFYPRPPRGGRLTVDV